MENTFINCPRGGDKFNFVEANNSDCCYACTEALLQDRKPVKYTPKEEIKYPYCGLCYNLTKSINPDTLFCEQYHDILESEGNQVKRCDACVKLTEHIINANN